MSLLAIALLPLPGLGASPTKHLSSVLPRSQPTTNLTHLNHATAPSWVSEPDTRGTWGLLTSCLFTLALCVFTAIHLNVGPVGESRSAFWLRKGKWALVAVIAPEIVLYSAGKQWFSASKLCRRLNEQLDKGKLSPPTVKTGLMQSNLPPANVTKDHPRRYTIAYGYYVLMGGFLVDVSRLHNRYKRLTIGPKGVTYLASHGVSLKMPASEIADKSKADDLTKGLVCIQVSWLLLQTIARKAVGYPITQLELHVIMHCVCALGMYGLWFSKPLDIRDPTWVDSSDFEDLLAVMLARNYGLGEKACIDDNQAEAVNVRCADFPYHISSESSYVIMDTAASPAVDAEQPATKTEVSAAKHEPESSGVPERMVSSPPSLGSNYSINVPPWGSNYSINVPAGTQSVRELVPGQFLECGMGPAENVIPAGTVMSSASQKKLRISLSERDVRRWTLASEALTRTGESLHPLQKSVNYLHLHCPDIFIDRKGISAGFFGYFCSWASGGLIAALVLCAFYGAIHALAWNFEFPSTAERILWRIASIDIIGGTITVLALFSVLVFQHEHGWPRLVHTLVEWEPGLLPVLFRLVIFLGLLNLPLFVVARLYIVIECFVSLRRVPLGVYQSPQWTNYLPHV